MARGTLTVADGKMTFHVSLASKKIVNLYLGTAEDAPSHESDWLQPTTDTVTYSDGTSDEVYGYDIPLDAVDTDFQLAILGTKGTWYDHTVSVRNAEPKTEDAAAETAAAPADGSYTCAVTLEGGSGRATVESPAALTVADGTMTAVIVWSSPNYDYMLIDGEKYLPTNTEGNSTFEIPVAALDTALAVTADTVAMSTPHEIDYTLTFDSATLTPRRIMQTKRFGLCAALSAAALLLLAGCAGSAQRIAPTLGKQLPAAIRQTVYRG